MVFLYKITIFRKALIRFIENVVGEIIKSKIEDLYEKKIEKKEKLFHENSVKPHFFKA